MKTQRYKTLHVLFGLLLILAAPIFSCSKPAEPILKSIAVTTMPTKTHYKIGDTLDISGLVVTGSYSDGSTKTIPVITSQISGFDSKKEGTLTLTITANDFTTTFEVFIDPVTYPAGIKKETSNDLLVLTLNLHTYQETNQEAKLMLIAKVIADLDVDLVAFQECAQNRTSNILDGNIRTDNMAYRITQLLQQNHNRTYYYKWDWAHYGWDVWEEGIAVLTPYPVEASEARLISSTSSTSNIVTRKVIYGRTKLPNIGYVNLFSAHTHWRTSLSDQEQTNQINNIRSMVSQKHDSTTALSLVCGDFNGNATSDYPWSEGYNTMVANNDFVDTFLAINPDANNKPAQSKFDTVKGTFPGRIDYIFMKNNPNFSVSASYIIFSPASIGEVSDHYGVITKLTKK